eukprot:gene17876-biopygen11422
MPYLIDGTCLVERAPSSAKETEIRTPLCFFYLWWRLWRRLSSFSHLCTPCGACGTALPIFLYHSRNFPAGRRLRRRSHSPSFCGTFSAARHLLGAGCKQKWPRFDREGRAAPGRGAAPQHHPPPPPKHARGATRVVRGRACGGAAAARERGGRGTE